MQLPLDCFQLGIEQSVLQYEDELLQALAQSVMPMGRLTDSADKAAALSASLQEQPVRQREDLLAQELLSWFKHEFFTWVSNAAVLFSCFLCWLPGVALRLCCCWFCGTYCCSKSIQVSLTSVKCHVRQVATSLHSLVCVASSDKVDDCSTHVGATTMVQVNSPACNHCGSQDMRSTGSAQPTAEEAQSDAGRVEVHSCSACNCTTRSTVLLCCMHNTFRLAPCPFQALMTGCVRSTSNFASTVPCTAQPCSQHASSAVDLHAYPRRLSHVGRHAFMVLMQH